MRSGSGTDKLNPAKENPKELHENESIATSSEVTTTGISGDHQEEEKLYQASQAQLIWRKFKQHKLAVIGAFILIIMYLIAIFCEFVAPYGKLTRFEGSEYAPPTKIHILDESGRLRFPFVYDIMRERNPETYRYEFREDTEKRYTIKIFVKGESYKMWGLFDSQLHLFGTGDEDVQVFLFGADGIGRDLFSRTIYGAQISLSIGLVGVFVTFILGLFIGGLSGFFGGAIDEIIQRTIDLLISIPKIPFWMVLSAALPRDWSVPQTYFAITILLSILGWAGLARVVRGKLLSLREEDFAMAAKVAGASNVYIITRHLIPSFMSHIIVSITVAIPAMILGETALSFLGLGMKPPAVSWGVLLQDAQKIVEVAHHPWLLIPCLFVILTVLMFNFMGDGLRDAADPYR